MRERAVAPRDVLHVVELQEASLTPLDVNPDFSAALVVKGYAGTASAAAELSFGISWDLADDGLFQVGTDVEVDGFV